MIPRYITVLEYTFELSLVIPESKDKIFSGINYQLATMHIIFNKDVFKIFYALHTAFIDRYTHYTVISTSIYRCINTQFVVPICILNHYVLRYINPSQYCPISTRERPYIKPIHSLFSTSTIYFLNCLVNINS